MYNLDLLGRKRPLFTQDVNFRESQIREIVSKSKFLVLGAAGTIGQAVCKEIFKRDPVVLHAIDISENNLAELVRDIRSSFGYINGDFKTAALDIGSREFDMFHASAAPYDFVLNLSALKHVRSEKDPYTLMRMINVNILNTEKTLQQAIRYGAKKYFAVSTDKAANPVNMMGASKAIMELFLRRSSHRIDISTARFANVAFSDGSLLDSFRRRIEKQQPIVAPNDIKRYFVTQKEAGELCLLSTLFGDNRDIYFPKLNENFQAIGLNEIAKRYLDHRGFQCLEFPSETEARQFMLNRDSNNAWACYFSESNTTGEKLIEEFYTEGEILDVSTFNDIGIVKVTKEGLNMGLCDFEMQIKELVNKSEVIDKKRLVKIFQNVLPNFKHKETGRNLDDKM